jgi:uncharacterized membrane protein YdjX (TVP38/TMEM64 family)
LRPSNFHRGGDRDARTEASAGRGQEGAAPVRAYQGGGGEVRTLWQACGRSRRADRVEAAQEKRAPKGKVRLTIRAAVLLAALLGLAALWEWTALADRLEAGRLDALLDPLRQSPAAALTVVGLYLLGGLLVVPVTLMIAVTGLVFGAAVGFIYAMLGALSSAALTYWLGRALGRDAVSRLAGRWVDRVLRDLSYRGLLAVATVRVMPLAPFSVINAVAGAIGIRFRDFMLGTLLGMTPGALALVLFVDRVQSAAGQPDVARWATAAGVLLVIALSALGARRWLRRGGALLIGVSLAVSALGAPADPVLARARSVFADRPTWPSWQHDAAARPRAQPTSAPVTGSWTTRRAAGSDRGAWSSRRAGRRPLRLRGTCTAPRSR